MNDIQIIIGKVLTLGITANGNSVATIVLTADDSADYSLPKRVEARFYVAKADARVPSPVVSRGTPYTVRAIINYKDTPMVDNKGVQLVTKEATSNVPKGSPMVHTRDELFILSAEELSPEEWNEYKG